MARRKQAPVPMLADALFLTAALTGATALVVGIFGIAEPQTKFVAIFILAVAMGEQIAATRMLNVAEMLMPAATMIVHGLGYDSPAAGGRSERTFRRVGVVLALCAGAASGALLALWHVWAALLLPAAALCVAAVLAHRIVPADHR